jgi:hypothetical protein
MIEPIFPPGLSVIVALLVLGVLLFYEIKRKLKHLPLRIVAQVLLVLSVLLLTLRPSLTTTSSQRVLLLTDGYEQSTVDSLTTLKPVVLHSYNELTTMAGVKVIAGDGLPSWALDLLPSKNYSFKPTPIGEGIAAIETDEHIYAHRWNNIRGAYSGSATIKLHGPGGIDDSVKVSNGTFNLSFFAKAPGKFNYELITPSTKDILPLLIEPERTFNILFISNYPTFETRYLKNFLASKGHSLSIRNQVSKGKYKFEFANRPTANFQSLTPQLLNDNDLMLIDESSWNSLSSAEQKNINTAIINGLGVIIVPDKGKTQLIPFTATQDKDTARISLGRAGSVRLPALAFEVKKSNAVLTATGNRIVSGYVHSGSGKIGYQLLSETFQQGLQGNADIYSSLWVPLLEKISRSEKNDFKLRITSPFPHYENEPITFDIVSSGKEPNIEIDNVDFPLTEDVFIDDLWHGTVWLEGNSWHDFTVDSAKTSLHVSKEGTWRLVYKSNNRKATAMASAQGSSDESTLTLKDDTKIKIVLFVLFMMAVGFIWLSPKL